MNITDAKALYIAEPSNSSEKKLFKITKEGYILEVTYENEEDEEITFLYSPKLVVNVNDNYVIVGFGDSFHIYLVRKSDGALFSLANVGYPSTSKPFDVNNYRMIQSDDFNNIYYIRYKNDIAGIVQIDVSNPELLVAIDYTPDTDNVYSYFVVTPNSHIAYAYDGGGSNRIRKSNCGLHNLPSQGYLLYWVGLDGNIKYQGAKSDFTKIYTVNIDQVTFDVNVSFVDVSDPENWTNIQSVTSYILRFYPYTIVVDAGCSDKIFEVENPTNNPKMVTINQINDIKIVDCSTNYYYLAGNDNENNPTLLKVNPLDNSVIVLLPNNSIYYDIYKMVVSPDDVVIFNALRMSDGAKVIGEIDSNGVVSILNESLNTEIVVLERIN
jgi:hypothetical protein